jgi:hypothetical protein
MSALEAVRLVREAAPRVLRPGGMVQVSALVEVPEALGSARQTVAAWFSGPGVAGLDVTEFAVPEFTVTREQLDRRRLHGLTQLAGNRAEADRLIAHLLRRRISSVVPVMIRFSI